MRITLHDRLVARTANEGASVAFTAKCWTDTSEPWVAATPTTVRYRVDDPETGCEIVPWTSASASSSQTITVTGAQNTLTGCEPRERRQITVQADVGLATVCVATRDWYVTNRLGIAA